MGCVEGDGKGDGKEKWGSEDCELPPTNLYPLLWLITANSDRKSGLKRTSSHHLEELRQFDSEVALQSCQMSLPVTAHGDSRNDPKTEHQRKLGG